MPTNAVYQPTTVSFENSGAIFPQTTTSSRLKHAFRKPWMKILLLILTLFFIALGLILFAASFADYEDAIHNEEVVTELPVHEKEFDVVLMILGGVFALFGIFLLVLYIKVIDCWRRSCVVCPCSYRKKQGLVLQGHSGGQIPMSLNPSTDPLVSHTQYAPISEIPRYEDEEERNKLMQDKDGANAEESHLLPDSSDPRIVLKPLSTQD